MTTKTATQLAFEETIKEVHALLKPLGFKKKSLNFYRQKNGFHQLINIQKSAYISANSIRFTMNICTDIIKKDDKEFPSQFDLSIRERIGFINDNSDKWHYFEGEHLDIFKRKQHFLEEKELVLNDIKTIVLPFFENTNSVEKMENNC